MSDDDHASGATAKNTPLLGQVRAHVAVPVEIVVALPAGRWIWLWGRRAKLAQPDPAPVVEAEASAILDRVERELLSVEEQTSRLMHQYGL